MYFYDDSAYVYSVNTNISYIINMALMLNFVNYNYESMIAEAVNNFYVEKKNLDVVFICKGNIQVLAHKIVIVSASSFLKDTLSSVTQDTIFISLPDITEFQLRKVINVLYKGSVELNIEDLVDLKDLVSFLGIDLNNAEVHMSQKIIDAFDEDNQEKTDNASQAEKDIEEFQIQISESEQYHYNSVSSEISPTSPLLSSQATMDDQALDNMDFLKNKGIHTSLPVEQIANKIPKLCLVRVEQTSPLLSSQATRDEQALDNMNFLKIKGIHTTSLPVEQIVNKIPKLCLVRVEQNSIGIVNTESVDEYSNLNIEKNNSKSTKKLEKTSKAITCVKITDTVNLLTANSRIHPDISLTPSDSIGIVNTESVGEYNNLNIEKNKTKSTKKLEQTSKAITCVKITDIGNSLTANSRIDTNISLTPSGSPLHLEGQKICTQRNGSCELLFKKNDIYVNQYSKLDKQNSNFSKNLNFDIVSNSSLHRVCSFKCNFCKSSFKTKDQCTLHEKVHNDSTSCTCNKCGQIFNVKRNLVSHMRVCIHEKCSCKICGFTDSCSCNVKAHTEIQRNEICDKTFSKSNTLTVLKGIHTRKKPYKCEICGKRFNVKGALFKHVRIHTGKTPYTCKVCNTKFKSKQKFIIHLGTHTVNKLCNCEICNRKFKSKTLFIHHIKTHSDKKIYKCEICDKSFSRLTNINCHKRIHTGEKPYKCEICDKSFTELTNINRHKRIHTGEKPYKCETCNREFRLKEAIIYHMNIHTGKRPFKCEMCDKSYTQVAILNKHKRIHTGEKPYKCGACNKGFTSKDALVRHTRIHTGEKFKCDICNKLYTHFGNFYIHKRIHTGEKPYKCDLCNKGFTRKNMLVCHMRTHTGEKPFKCKICNKMFTQDANLRVHERKHVGSNK